MVPPPPPIKNNCPSLNGKSSNWSSVSAGVPDGSVLGPLFYINDLVETVSSDAKLLANDT